MTFSKADVLAIMKRPTERDQQVKVGASNISNMCTRCLAEDMSGGGEDGPQRYWMGAWHGTAMHERLEGLVPHWNPEALPENRVVLGEIKGYGAVKSTSDLYVNGDVVDWKSTTRAKVVFNMRALETEPDSHEVTKVTEARHKVEGYRNQLMLYGLGMENAGHEVKNIVVVFICRDGLTDDDVHVYSEPYNRQRALDLMDRAQRVWDWLQAGNDPTEFEHHRWCFYNR